MPSAIGDEVLAEFDIVLASLHEVIDGAGGWSKFWKITVPLIRPRRIRACRASLHLTYVWDGTRIAQVYEKKPYGSGVREPEGPA